VSRSWDRYLTSIGVDPGTPTHDRLSVLQASLATFHGQPGGEWDTLRGWPLRSRQRLAGAGWMARHGEKPDVFAEILCNVFGEQTVGPDPIAWYLREAERAVRECQAAARRLRHARLAASHGHRTYYAYRAAWVRSLGYRSLWEYRKDQGWQTAA
jgi:hypothetical protein